MNNDQYNNELNQSGAPVEHNFVQYQSGGYVPNQQPVVIPISQPKPENEVIDIVNEKVNPENVQPEENKNENQPQPQVSFKNLPDIEKAIRLGFIKKVYGIFLSQLVLTFGLVCITFIDVVSSFLRDHIYIFYIVIVASLALFLVLICGKKIARKVPVNYILLTIWTLLESYMLATAAAYYDYQTVLSAIGITVGLAIGLTLFACFVKVDFTFCGGLLCALGAIMLFFAIFGFVFGKWAYTGYCAIGVFIYSLYLIYDTQLILGQFRNKYSIDDYVLAAMNLYIDMVNIFLYILTLMGLSK